MSSHTGQIQLVLAALRDVGDMTALEVARHLDIGKDNAAALLGQLRSVTPRFPEPRAHVCAYTYDDEGGKKYPRPIYRFGPGKDAPKPKPIPKMILSREQRDRLRARNRSTSVFNLAASHRVSSLKHTACATTE